MNLYEYEQELYDNGCNFIAGVDEVGRGPLIGSVVSACVILPKGFAPEGLNDSKKLSEKQRNKFYKIIEDNAIAIGIGVVDASEIDRINIYQASKKSMLLAISDCKHKIDHVLIDAMKLDLDIPSTSIIKGDAKSISIAAASVIAKVTRDAMMYELDKKYPMYGYGNHKGYPTKKHIEAIHKYGLIDGYRKTYKPVSDYINSL
ncbi:MAG TPA: ribonuclease HII [Bacilli bacterium]|nr:ribonuclease HII [Bacilli bacterium]